MKCPVPLLFLLLVPLTAVAGEDDECVFDQAGVESALLEVADRTPGYKHNPTARSVSWSLPAGRVVSVSYGGCAHLGLDVRLGATAPSGTPTLEELLEAVATFWSREDAANLRMVLASGQVVTSSPEPGVTIIEPSAHGLSGFPNGFYLSFRESEAGASWQID